MTSEAIAGAATYVDLITCSTAAFPFSTKQVFGNPQKEATGEIRRQQVLATRMPLQPGEIFVHNRPRDFKVGGTVVKRPGRTSIMEGGTPVSTKGHPKNLPEGSGRTHEYRFPNGVQFNDETPLPYRYHAEVLGLTAGVELILATPGGGQIVALGIAGRKSDSDGEYSKVFCPELCQGLLRRYGFALSTNLRCAWIDGFPALEQEARQLQQRAKELHAQKPGRTQSLEVTCITRVELHG